MRGAPWLGPSSHSAGGERIVLDGRADHCCAITVEGTAVTLLFDVLAEWLG
ncbi:MAG: hypothetical protein ACRDTX_07115 [Pseudonocardiaceae bacterium]